MKGAILIAAVIAAVALGACRREEQHVPMKLGAPVAEQVRGIEASCCRDCDLRPIALVHNCAAPIQCAGAMR